MAMPKSTTLRIRTETRDRLNQLARASRLSNPELLERLVAREERERQLEQMNRGFASLRSQGAAWAEFKDETDAWDAAAAEIPADD